MEDCLARFPDAGNGSLSCNHRRALMTAGEPMLTPESNAIRLSMVSYFRRPLLITVAFKTDGTADLTASVVGRSGHEACVRFQRRRMLPADLVSSLREALQATDSLPDERQLIKAEDDALDAKVAAANAADPAHEEIVIRNDEMAVFRLLEKGYGGRYSLRRLRDENRPQFTAFKSLCRDLIALAELPSEANDYADE